MGEGFGVGQPTYFSVSINFAFSVRMSSAHAFTPD
jgi:hypothetical protein